jgi:hypothetical protein
MLNQYLQRNEHGPQEVRPVLTPEEVYATACAALISASDQTARKTAEERLAGWEATLQPGYLTSLLTIVEQHDQPQARLMAATLAKNALGCSIQAAARARARWGALGEPEKVEVRTRTLNWLQNQQNPDSRQGACVQVAQLAANIVRFDYPEQWPTVISDLMTAILFDSPTPLASKYLLVVTIRHIVDAQFERPIVCGQRGLKHALEQVANAPKAIAIQLYEPLQREWARYHQSAYFSSPGEPFCPLKAKIANYMMKVLTKCTLLVPELKHRPMDEAAAAAGAGAAAEPSLTFFSMLPQTLRALCDQFFQPDQQLNAQMAPQLQPLMVLARKQAVGKAIVYIARAGCAAIEKHPLHFCSHLQPWLQIFVTIVQHADATHAEISPKLIIYSTKLLGKACASQWYAAATEQHSGNKYALMIRQYPQAAEQMHFAAKVMDTVFSEEVCEALLSALMRHYVPITPGTVYTVLTVHCTYCTHCTC